MSFYAIITIIYYLVKRERIWVVCKTKEIPVKICIYKTNRDTATTTNQSTSLHKLIDYKEMSLITRTNMVGLWDLMHQLVCMCAGLAQRQRRRLKCKVPFTKDINALVP